MIYLPGVSRETLRAAEACPPPLVPLVWFGVAGAWFGHVNGKDWTVTAFLQANQGGLQLKITRDNATATSIRRAIDKLVDVPVAELRGKAAGGELNSTYFDSLISDDPVDDDADARELAAVALATRGAYVVTATDAVTALELFGMQDIHVLVADLAMPNVDGYELLKRVRSNEVTGQAVQAIALTAQASPEEEARAFAAQ